MQAIGKTSTNLHHANINTIIKHIQLNSKFACNFILSLFYSSRVDGSVWAWSFIKLWAKSRYYKEGNVQSKKCQAIRR